MTVLLNYDNKKKNYDDKKKNYDGFDFINFIKKSL